MDIYVVWCSLLCHFCYVVVIEEFMYLASGCIILSSSSLFYYEFAGPDG